MFVCCGGAAASVGASASGSLLGYRFLAINMEL